jgi:L-ascorbate 6-phosphate lactonase
MTDLIEVIALGQTGYRIRFGRHVVVVDPYLSDSVEALAGPGARRLHRVPLEPKDATGVDLVLLTHAHQDHCDPETLKPLSEASPKARFIAPTVCHPILRSLGISEDRVQRPPVAWSETLPDLELTSIPSCHPTVRVASAGDFECVGYGLRFDGRLLYHAGDTVASDQVLQAVRVMGRPDWAFLPVNETNFFRSRADIVGNMSPREAFQFADEIGAREVVPTHWDLFPANCVPMEEIELVYRLERRRHRLRVIPIGTTARLHPFPND